MRVAASDDVRIASEHGYDVVPYRGTAVPSADVRRIQSIASLFGMTPAAPAAARVLEIGCGTGANLLPLAVEYPHARIIGCDLAGSAIAAARDMADRLGAVNLEFRQANLSDVDDQWGEFDYILCHDVFSWVAPEVRRNILEIQARNLSPQGVGFVSYDALPGWRLHEVAREMMRYHTRRLDGLRNTIEQARAVLSMAALVQDQSTGAYASLIRDEYCLMSSIPDEQLYHLISEEHHHPLYFHEFLGEVDGANLQWLADAGREMFGLRLPTAAQSFLDQVPFLERQQYADLLNNCTFRRALLCRRDVRVCRSPDERVFRKLWIGLAGGARLESASVSGEMCLSTDRGELRTPDPAISEGLVRLDSARPEYLPFSRLFGSDHDDSAVDFMMNAFGLGAIDVVLSPFTLTNRIAEFPMVGPVARLEARQGGAVTNQKSEPVPLSDLMRFVVQLLDGSHDRTALTEAIAREIELNGLVVDLQFVVLDEAKDASKLTDECLRYIRDHALLIDQSSSS